MCVYTLYLYICVCGTHIYIIRIHVYTYSHMYMCTCTCVHIWGKESLRMALSPCELFSVDLHMEFEIQYKFSFLMLVSSLPF